jgi:uncharacterized membrane protein YhaH (DUF805 family)
MLGFMPLDVWRPLGGFQMNFVEAIQSGFRNYVNFSGRAQRSAFWYWVLFAVIAAIVAGMLDNMVFGEGEGPIGTIVSLALFLPGLSVSVRRLHDIDRTGWWVLLAFTVIGIIVLIIFNCTKGTPGPNRFGPDPLGGM